MSVAFNFLTAKCDGENSLMGLAVPAQICSIAFGIVLTVSGIAEGIFQTVTQADAIAQTIWGLSWIVGGATGYLGISLLAFVAMSSLVLVAPKGFFGYATVIATK